MIKRFIAWFMRDPLWATVLIATGFFTSLTIYLTQVIK